MNPVLSIDQIVAAGLCIGCGLCEALAPGKIRMTLTPEGRERPVECEALDTAQIARINEVCPGTRIGGAPAADAPPRMHDVVWGGATRLLVGHAADPLVRHRASSGGALTALGRFLLASGEVRSVLHVAAAANPLRAEPRLSVDGISVLDGAGSRYGPAAPLTNFMSLLDREEPFAIIAKPCDISAVRNLARIDARVDRYLRYALTMICGGASDLTKTEEILRDWRVRPEELTALRYRGNGNPGPLRVETTDGRSYEMSYQQMWEDEATWRIQPRCKICPDAIGEGADLVASDVWPGGGPTGEDEGFNGIIVRTERGLDLFDRALAAGVLVVDRGMSFGDLDEFQPHQVRKKRFVWARLAGMRAAGMPVPQTHDLRLEECARLNTPAQNLAEARGARLRSREGHLGEPPARARDESIDC